MRDRVTGPAGMDETGFLLSEADRPRAAATEDCPWRGRIVRGTVHDVFVVLLTNRVHPVRMSDAITRLRPRFHNAAVTACLAARS